MIFRTHGCMKLAENFKGPFLGDVIVKMDQKKSSRCMILYILFRFRGNRFLGPCRIMFLKV